MENVLKEAKTFADFPCRPGFAQCQICGAVLRNSNRARHVRTDKHKLCKYVWSDRFEITRFPKERGK